MVRGTVRKIGVEGGVWALVTDDGRTLELLDVPEALREDGIRAEIDADTRGADASIGMVGTPVRVKKYRRL